MTKVSVTVAIADSYLSKFGDVLKRTKRAGLDIEQALKDIGVLTGKIDFDKVAALRKVKGIASVETSRSVHIAPPDSPVQ
jgi:hypothetical protein